MHKYLIFLACFLTFSSTQALEEAGGEEFLLETIEAQRLIVNWQPSTRQLGTLLVYRCETCEILRLTIDRDTRLVSEGQELDIATLAQKADWSGHVTISSQAPKHVLKLAIFH